MKRTFLERTLMQIGSRDSGNLTLAQFNALLDAIQREVEVSHLDASGLDDDEEGEEETLPVNRAGTRTSTSTAAKKGTGATGRTASADGAYASQALNTSPRNRISTRPTDTAMFNRPVLADLDDDMTTAAATDDFDDDVGYDSDDFEDDADIYRNEREEEDEEDGEVEISEEAAAMEVYDELRGAKESASVADFLQWADVRELLEVGALSKDQLAQAMSTCEVDVENGDRTDLPFEKVPLRSVSYFSIFGCTFPCCQAACN